MKFSPTEGKHMVCVHMHNMTSSLAILSLPPVE